jgi:hypothetical protein
VADVITALPTRLALRSVPIALYDLGYNLGVARRLVPAADVAAACATYRRVTTLWNQDQVRVLRLALAAADDGDRGAVEALLRTEQPRVRAHDDALLDECDRALVDVERAVSLARRRRVRAHARGRLLSAVAFSTGLAAACNQSPQLPIASDGAAAADATASYDLSSTDDLTISSTDLAGCGDAGARPVVPHLDSCLCAGGLSPSPARLTFDANGHLVDVEAGGDGGSLSSQVLDCIRNLIGAYCYPSLAGTTQEVTGHCWIA